MVDFLMGLVFSMALNGESPQACLALNIWHEARGESLAGMSVVAQNVISRVESPYYSDSVCGVVFETMPGGAPAYSWLGDDLPDVPVIRNSIDLRSWEKAWLVAGAFLAHDNPVRFSGLESGVLYHRDTICPSFCRSPYAKRLAQVGGHVIYQESRTRPFIQPKR